MPYIGASSQRNTRNGLVFITNFSKEYYETYEKAIHYYNQLAIPNKAKLEIRETSNGCSGYGLWRHPTEKHIELSLFWDICELVKSKRTAILELLQNQELQTCNNLK